MDISKFKEIEEKYRVLKDKLDTGAISADEMKRELKQLMVTDEAGFYWMIGGKTGKWYTYRDNEWKEESPYIEDSLQTQQFEPEEAKTIAVEPEQVTVKIPDEKRIELEEQTEQPDSDYALCRSCKSRIDTEATFCPVCGASQTTTAPLPAETGQSSDLLVQSIKYIPMIFFFGGLGMIIGVLFGATFGIFDILGDIAAYFPTMLQETRGKIQGGLIFAAMGGIAGFLGFALFSVILSSIYNFISYIFGGLRFRIKQ